MVPRDPENVGKRPIGLVVDNDSTVRAVIREVLEEREVLTLGAGSAPEAAEMLRTQRVSVLMVDLQTPGVANIDLLRYGLQLKPAPVVVGICDPNEEGAAGRAVDAGAFDVLVKPLAGSRVRFVVERSLRQLELLGELRRLGKALRSREGYDRIVGRSRVIERLRHELERLGPQPTPVWLSGEPGTGKELAARTLHESSQRREQPFVVINCAGLSEEGWRELVRSGSSGLLRPAGGGSLYLDGVTELDNEAQIGLHALLGDPQRGPAAEHDVRILSSSTRPPRQATAQAQLTPELFERLASVRLELPPLAERAEDIPLLANHFVATITEINRLQPIRLSPEALTVLDRYRWPGQVRELRNAIEHAVILCADGRIRSSDLPDRIREAEADSVARRAKGPFSTREFRDAKREVVESFEEAYLSDLLERHGGNVTSASQQAGMLRSALQRLLRKYGFKSADFRKRQQSRRPRQETRDSRLE